MALHAHTVAVFALAVCLVLPGCKRKLSDANLSCVRLEMRPKEVESILGQPTSIEHFEMPLQADVKTLDGQRYVYEQNGKKVVLHFVDDKLIGQEGSFDK